MCKKVVPLASLFLMLCVATETLGADAFLQDEGPDGIVSVLAIHYDSKNNPALHDWVPYSGPNDVSGYPGGDAMRVEPDLTAEDRFGGLCGMDFNIYLNRAGIYYVWVLGWGPDGGSDSCHVAIDDVQLNNFTGFNQNYRWVNTIGFDGELATIKVAQAGTHTLSINGREGFTVIEKCIVTTNPGFRPTQDIDLRPDGTEPAESPRGPAEAPTRAYNPTPVDLVTDVTDKPTLTWSAGQGATRRDVYFGTDADAVANADKTNPLFKGSQDDTRYTPDDAPLAWNATYYWRVDEVDSANAVIKGNTWSFTTADFLIVEDFESYNEIPVEDEGSNLVYSTWQDGYANPMANGSTMGNPTGLSINYENVHGGLKSSPLLYDNTVAGSSEVSREWTKPQDWSQHNLKSFSMWIAGDAANSAEPLYVTVGDGNKEATIGHPDPNAVLEDDWNEFFFVLSDINDAGVNLSAITKLTIGIGEGTAGGGFGTLLIDDVRIYQLIPRPDIKRHPYDLDGSGVVDSGDLDLLEQTFGHEFLDPATGDYGLYLEAEDGLITGMTTYEDPPASGGKFIGTEWGEGNAPGGPNGNSRVSWTFTTDTSGIYRVAFKDARFPTDPFNGNAGKHGWIRMDYDNNLVTDASLHNSGWIRDNIPNVNELTWDWVVADGAPVEFTLGAGEHVLEFERRMAGSMIDVVLITSIATLELSSFEPQETDLNGDGVVDDQDRTLMTDALGEEVLWP